MIVFKKLIPLISLRTVYRTNSLLRLEEDTKICKEVI